MCGRYMLVADEGEVRLRFNVGIYDELYRPRYNCAPSQSLPLICNKQAEVLHYARWGLLPSWTKTISKALKPINARAETLIDKPFYKDAFLQRRCLVSASAYFEWTQNKQKRPFLISLPETNLFAMAGIWEEWKDAEGELLRSFAIITTVANSLTASIHPRMPVILKPEDEHTWLNETDVEKLSKLLTPYSSKQMRLKPVSSYVNSVQNDSEKGLQDPPQELFEF